MSENIRQNAKKTETRRGNLISHKPKKRLSQTKSKNSPVDHILHLQRTIGNRAVARLIKSGTIQAKLTIGKPNDIYEKEADSVADRVMSMPEGALAPAPASSPNPKRQEETLPNHWMQKQPDEEEELKAKPLAEQITPLVQRQAEEEEEAQTKIQRQAEEEEEKEPIQTKLIQRQGTDEEEEPIQAKSLQRQESEEEKEAHTKLQRQVEEEEEESIQTKLIQRQGTEEEEEPVQTKLQRQEAEEEEESVQTKLLQRQGTEEEEESIQAKSVQRQESEEEEEAQTKLQRQAEEEEETAQAKATPGNTLEVTPNIESNINSMKGGGQPLSESTRSYFEPRFGADFSQVRVHTDSRAAQTAQAINAKAFTTGKDIAFNSSQYSPGTSSGKRLLAHELTHVMQQGHAGGSQNTPQGNVQFIKIRRHYSGDLISPSIKDCRKRRPRPGFKARTVKGDECGPQYGEKDPMLKRILNWLASKATPEYPLFPLLYMGDLCKAHDYCYQECNTDYPAIKDEEKQKQCDDDFYRGARKKCQESYGANAIIPITRKWYQKILAPFNLIKNLSSEIVKLPFRALCKLVAWLYYKAVSKLGKSAFLDGQEDACICDERVSKPSKMKALVNVSYLLLTDNPRKWKVALRNRKSPHRLAMLKRGTEVSIISKDPKREQPWNKTPAKYGDKYQWWYVEYDPSKGKSDKKGKKQKRTTIRGWVEQRGLSK